MKKKIVFLTGTRAEYSKIKSILQILKQDVNISALIFVTGMHLEEKFGYTYNEIIKDGFLDIFLDERFNSDSSMNNRLGHLIIRFDNFVKEVQPDMIVVHGDRLDALAGAIVGAFNNIIVSHIEGGEITGTIDESIRHAITKFAHLHFVANEEAKLRLIQLGEVENNIYIIGSPDIDIMLNKSLPSLQTVIDYYDINFTKFAIVLYHPVVTELEAITKNTKELIHALEKSNHNYLVIYPNNDAGNEKILEQYQELKSKTEKFQIFSSLKFEYFLTLLKNASFIIGNSSAGIREACVYGIPAIDLGTRQQGRYKADILKNIISLPEYTEKNILKSIEKIEEHKIKNSIFGTGKSAEGFYSVVSNSNIWDTLKQKRFVDIETSLNIQ